MLEQDYLDELRGIREKIEENASDILEGLAGDSEKTSAFQIGRANLDDRIRELERRQLRDLAAALDANATELRNAVTGLKGDLGALDNVVKAVDTFTTLLALAARIAAAA